MKNKENTWYGLDNAANLYPAISNDRNTNVFRLSCVLFENIDSVTLQTAVDQALRHFPYFRVVMRRGLFWHYLEQTDLNPVVHQEAERPCGRIFYNHVKELLFHITYYGPRINLEVFHAVADGGGAIALLRAIVYNYILLAHRAELPEKLPALDREAPPAHQAEDSFAYHYDPTQKESPFRGKAYAITGTTLPSNSVKVISGILSTKQMLALAKSKGVTVTSYLCALLICCIYTGLVPKRASHRRIGVTVPVDLRGHFQSETSRNFFGVIEVGYNFEGKPADFDQVLESISAQLTEAINPSSLARRVNYTMSVQKNIFARFTPLVFKNFVLSMAYKKGERSTTCALSNMGRITMPQPFVPFVKSFHCLLNPTPIHRVKACVSSFEDVFVINFTSCIEETRAQRQFFRHLSENGVDIRITTNGGTEDETM